MISGTLADSTLSMVSLILDHYQEITSKTWSTTGQKKVIQLLILSLAEVLQLMSAEK